MTRKLLPGRGCGSLDQKMGNDTTLPFRTLAPPRAVRLAGRPLARIPKRRVPAGEEAEPLVYIASLKEDCSGVGKAFVDDQVVVAEHTRFRTLSCPCRGYKPCWRRASCANTKCLVAGWPYNHKTSVTYRSTICCVSGNKVLIQESNQ